MLPKPRADLKQNTADFERLPLVKPTGFREYDARWLFPDEINLMGLNAIGLGLATLMRRRGIARRIVVGHDYRSYSAQVKQALMTGLLAGGAEIHDIGLALSPMAYYAQFALDVEAVAMVTASHNDNGWTGIKMGIDRPLTFGPDDMLELKQIVLAADFEVKAGGRYIYVPNMAERYIANLTDRPVLKRQLKVVAACGNGTAGDFAPKVLKAIGCDVIELNCDLDHSFPNHNPNPEDMAMLHALRDAVLSSGADVGLAFDGDGDRCGVVDNEGHEIFADKVGVMLARDISSIHHNAKFVVDVKSTGLFLTDPVLKANGAQTAYWKTGHSYIKRYNHEHGTLVGFEKSGHYFFSKPLGLGYDDGIISALELKTAMLHALRDAVLSSGADVGLAFDGDGDRCGVVDNEGHEIFADKVGVMLARDISSIHHNAKFVVDVKSTGLFLTDPVLKANGAQTAYWKTGHSYIKRYNHEHGTLVGFEKSGHYFFSKPLGLGYDDGIISALAVCDMLERNPGKTMADLKNDLPKTWGSPTMSPHCADEVKYEVVERVVAHFTALKNNGGKMAGQAIKDLITVNGIRIVLEDGSWGLVRASSNKPELVVVVESPTSEANMRAVFADIDEELARHQEVGDYNQKI